MDEQLGKTAPGWAHFPSVLELNLRLNGVPSSLLLLLTTTPQSQNLDDSYIFFFDSEVIFFHLL
jgi:hypothetical protein